MNIDLTEVLVVFFGGSFLVGLAAYRRSGKEADNQQAQAAASIVGAADDVVVMLRAQMERLEERVDMLETSHVAYEAWSQKVVDLLDRLLASEAAAHWHDDVAELKRTRPKHRGRD